MPAAQAAQAGRTPTAKKKAKAKAKSKAAEGGEAPDSGSPRGGKALTALTKANKTKALYHKLMSAAAELLEQKEDFTGSLGATIFADFESEVAAVKASLKASDKNFLWMEVKDAKKTYGDKFEKLAGDMADNLDPKLKSLEEKKEKLHDHIRIG